MIDRIDRFKVSLQEKYNLMGSQQPEKFEFENWDTDSDGIVTLAEFYVEWVMTLEAGY